VRLNQVSQVRGFADQRLHYPDKPMAAANRRVSLVVQNLATAKPELKGMPKQMVATATPEGMPVPKAEGGKPEAGKAAEGKAEAAKAETSKAESLKTEEGNATPSAMALPPAAEKPAAGLLARAKGMFK
jgi:chemotaxis protein MotB